MKKKQKIVIVSIVILLVLALSISLSYAYFILNVNQDDVNAFGTACFKITYEDENDIQLLSALPMKEGKAKTLTPYSFTIKNVCNQDMDYYINIETLDNTTMDLNAIRVKVDDNNSRILGSIDENDSSLFINDNAVSSKMIRTGQLRVGASRKFNLRMWIDYDAMYQQAVDKEFYSKVVVNVVNRKPNTSTLVSGPEFNKRVKELVGVEQDQEQINSINEIINSSNYSNLNYYNLLDDVKIKSIVYSDTAPGIDKNAIVVSTDDSVDEVLAWLDDDTIYLYSNSDIIELNRDSSYLFANMLSLENIDLSRFDTSNVVNMSAMFASLKTDDLIFNNLNNDEDFIYFAFMIYGEGYGYPNTNKYSNLSNVNLDDFNTSNVEDMSYMFMGLSNLSSLNIASLDTSNVINMKSMFKNDKSIKNLDLSTFNTSNVEDMNSMFCGTSTLSTLDLSSFNTSKVKDMALMFFGLNAMANIDIHSFDTSSVEDMSWMFAGMKSLSNLNLQSFITNNVVSMRGMFFFLRGLESLDVSTFDTKNVEDMSYMFGYMDNLTQLNVSNFNTSNVTNMSYMFADMKELTSLDLSNFDTSNVTNMSYMFYVDSNLGKIYSNNDWSTSSLNSISNDSSKMFYGCTHLSGSSTSFNSSHVDATYAKVDRGASNPGYFTVKTN